MYVCEKEKEKTKTTYFNISTQVFQHNVCVSECISPALKLWPCEQHEKAFIIGKQKLQIDST